MDYILDNLYVMVKHGDKIKLILMEDVWLHHKLFVIELIIFNIDIVFLSL